MNSQLLNLLFEDFDYFVTDPLWGDIPFNKALYSLIKTKAYQKLNRIKQNGPTYHVYPGAVHTRYNHSLGVYNLSREILITLLKHSAPPFSKKGIFSFLSACLLHDLGHFPYAHSLKELSIAEHEYLATIIIKSDEDILKALASIGAETEMVCAIIDTDIITKDEETLIYRKLLSGSLDPDKLDYLSRDAFFAGVPYGTQETDKVLHSLLYKKDNIIIRHNALSCVEHILFSKYLMYKNVYWHQETRSATAMVKKALLEALTNSVIKESDLYFIDDEEFAQLPKLYPDFAPFELISDEINGALFKCRFEKDYEDKGKLETLSKEIYSRHKTEHKIYEKLKLEYSWLKPYQVIIDIPEPIKFESDINVLTQDNEIIPFDQIDPIFNKEFKNLFSKSLRKVRIFTPERVSHTAMEKVIADEY